MPRNRPGDSRRRQRPEPDKRYPPMEQDIFIIHPPKVAGSAQATSLGISRTHDPASWIKEAAGEKWYIKKIIGTIRNPWDRALSWFMYNGGLRPLYAKTITDFNRWVEDGMPPYYKGTRGARLIYQEDFIEIDGICQLGFTLRFESLHDDWLKLFEWLGRTPLPLMTNDRVPYNEKPDYRDWYHTKSIEITKPLFAYFADGYEYAYGMEPGHVKRGRLMNGDAQGKTETQS